MTRKRALVAVCSEGLEVQIVKVILLCTRTRVRLRALDPQLQVCFGQFDLPFLLMKNFNL